MELSGCKIIIIFFFYIFHDFRNSSFFYYMFMVKNVLEILFAIVFVFFNTSWLWAYDFSESDDATADQE